MRPKPIIFGIITAIVLVVLFNNKEEASFWLFGEIRTSKLFILGAFFVLGVIVGGVVFRRRKAHPKEYNINNSAPMAGTEQEERRPYSHLSEEDRKFLGRD